MSDPIKQHLTVPPAQMQRIVEAGMEVVYGLDTKVSAVAAIDNNMTKITFWINEAVERPAYARYYDDDPLAQGEG